MTTPLSPQPSDDPNAESRARLERKIDAAVALIQSQASLANRLIMLQTITKEVPELKTKSNDHDGGPVSPQPPIEKETDLPFQIHHKTERSFVEAELGKKGIPLQPCCGEPPVYIVEQPVGANFSRFLCEKCFRYAPGMYAGTQPLLDAARKWNAMIEPPRTPHDTPVVNEAATLEALERGYSSMIEGGETPDPWTYIQYDSEGDYLEGEKEKLPTRGTAYFAFDALRWKVVIGYTEPGGYSSILIPNVSDDCNVVAFAPFGVTTDPDMDKIRACCPWRRPAYSDPDGVILLRKS